jgi:hypothetical protein
MEATRKLYLPVALGLEYVKTVFKRLTLLLPAGMLPRPSISCWLLFVSVLGLILLE